MKKLEEKLEELKNVKIVRKYLSNNIKAKRKEQDIILHFYELGMCCFGNFILYYDSRFNYEFIIYDTFIKIINCDDVLFYIFPNSGNMWWYYEKFKRKT